MAVLCQSCHKSDSDKPFGRCTTCTSVVHIGAPCSIVIGGVTRCSLCQTANRIQNQRAGAKRRLEEQAERMLQASRQRFEEAEVGQNVVVPIPDVDRGRGDPRNVMAVVMSINDGFYRLGTKHGVLNRLYVRNEMELCAQQFFTVDEVPETSQISLREAVGAASVSGRSQGFLKCNCTKSKCQTNGCKCKREGVLCNSRCHNSDTCCNK